MAGALRGFSCLGPFQIEKMRKRGGRKVGQTLKKIEGKRKKSQSKKKETESW